MEGLYPVGGRPRPYLKKLIEIEALASIAEPRLAYGAK
jgi:hypothetical protein